MTSITTNRVNQDVVELEIIQNGSDETEMTLKDVLLDGSKSYHFVVSELSVPLVECGMHPITKEFALFTVAHQQSSVRY